VNKIIIKRLFFNIDEILAGFCGVSMVFITIWGVIMRYIFNNPLKWVEEVSLGLFVWMIFLGAAAGFKKELHISINLLVDLFPAKAQRVIDFFIKFLTYVVLLIFTILGYQYCTMTNYKITPALRVPYYYIAVALPVGCIFMMIHITFALLRRKKF